MSTTETLVVYAFSIANAGRLLAYVPQIVLLLRDPGPATSISGLTWMLFLVSNGATLAYATVVLNDPGMALIFGANTACCAGIVGLLLHRRQKWRQLLRRRPNLLQVAN